MINKSPATHDRTGQWLDAGVCPGHFYSGNIQATPFTLDASKSLLLIHWVKLVIVGTTFMAVVPEDKEGGKAAAPLLRKQEEAEPCARDLGCCQRGACFLD